MARNNSGLLSPIHTPYYYHYPLYSNKKVETDCAHPS
jgi:hypothetical protein